MRAGKLNIPQAVTSRRRQARTKPAARATGQIAASPRALKRRTQGHVFAAASGASNAIGERTAPAKPKKVPAAARASSSATRSQQGDAPTLGFSKRSRPSVMRLKEVRPTYVSRVRFGIFGT